MKVRYDGPTIPPDRVIVFHPTFARAGGSAKAGIWLSWAFMLDTDEEGWFCRTAKECEADTCLTVKEQRTIRGHLRYLDLLRETRRGMPPTVCYLIAWGRIALRAQPHLPMETQHDNAG